MVNNYILDSNVVISILNGSPKVLSLIKVLAEEQFSISIVSRMEVLLGRKKHALSLEEMENYLDDYYNLPFDEELCRVATIMNEKSKKKLKFKDLIIAATAMVHNKTLVTSDKDFLSFKKLKVKYIGA